MPPFNASDIVISREFSAWENLPFDIEKETLSVISEVLGKISPDLHLRELSIVLAHDDMLRHLNKGYRHQDKPTNVLSFGYGEEPLKAGILGDLFLSFETLAREAAEQQKTFRDHYIHLIIHGILHLLGYDHENEGDAKVMEELEIQLLKRFNISNPYVIE